MRHVIRKDTLEIVSRHNTLEGALESLELHKEHSNESEGYYIGYGDVSLYLGDWEKRWISICKKKERKERRVEVSERKALERVPIVRPNEIWEQAEYEESNIINYDND